MLLGNLINVEQVWDVSGRKHFTFEGHDAPVYSILPHYKEDIQVWQGMNRTIFYNQLYCFFFLFLSNPFEEH